MGLVNVIVCIFSHPLDTMNTPLNVFFETEEKWFLHKLHTVYSRSIKRWVYKKDFQQRLSYYFSSMVKDYHKEKCSDLIRVYPANKSIQKSMCMFDCSHRCIYWGVQATFLHSHFCDKVRLLQDIDLVIFVSTWSLLESSSGKGSCLRHSIHQ